MGLCKCPKRKVTNQFCFEHRVNVCEHCMVTNHPKCIVQSYLQWLQDSDYNPICELCSQELAGEDCVRLVCYHVFHWTCLNQYARDLPPTTAPAGYLCPSCKVGIFPVPNLVSPVADVLREKLAGVNWARAGLGLPLLLEDRDEGIRPKVNDNKTLMSSVTEDISSNQRPHTPDQSVVSNSKFEHNHSGPSSNQLVNEHSVVNVEDPLPTFSRTDGFPVSGQVPRRVFEALDESRETFVDHDENKYKRRSAFEWFSRWWKSVLGPSPRRRTSGGHLYRRYWMAAILFFIGLLTLIVLFSWLGRMVTENDPNLDPKLDPQIRNSDRK
ncbi:zinc finger protein-like 1 homolog [Anabrus simplex]|uniref:zinc finger protein-like 1 homolog n=1 Tax=Anabrus simplex TaxID=316456 RepID=UPI0035A30E59